MPLKYYYILVGCVLLSCNSDPDDTSETSPSNVVITDTTFTDASDTTFFMGSNDCSSDGSYYFDATKTYDIDLTTEPLPPSLDLSTLLPAVGNQGNQGSCTSWAVTYYLKSFQEHLLNSEDYNDSNTMSPAYTYNQLTQGNCEGTAISATFDILKEQGSCALNLLPYNANTCSNQPTSAMRDAAMAYKISDYFYLTDEALVHQMKTLITQHTPIVIASWLSSAFGLKDNLGLTAYRPHNVDYNEQGGCHAMLVVGYNDDYNAFKVVNSWGEDWGDEGFLWIDYEAFENVSNPDAGFRVISEALIATIL